MALAGVDLWIEHQPAKQNVVGSSPIGHMPGLRARSLVEGVERQPHIDVSLPPFLPPSPLSKRK